MGLIGIPMLFAKLCLAYFLWRLILNESLGNTDWHVSADSTLSYEK